MPPMQRYVAFLGGVNVGGHRITGPELVAEFAGLGFTDVATFLASGNVVFSAESLPVAKMTASIEKRLHASFGYALPSFLRTSEQVLHIADQQPFPPEAIAASHGKLQVAMLLEPPDAAGQKTVRELSSDQDKLVIDATELYWLPSGGISESDLDLKTLFAALGPSTMRTVNTVRRIAAKFL
jgi:uncharacterized protein (DUF1697 family)